MFKAIKQHQGFSTVELITVLIIIGILAATSVSVFTPSRTLQLQSSRDQIVTAVQTAQQRAMSRQRAVRVVFSSNQVDVQDDVDGDGLFTPANSVTMGGVVYPISLPPNQTLGAATFVFNRLGETTGADIALTQSAASVSISITDAGYAY